MNAGGGARSGFSDVDRSDRPEYLLAYLDAARRNPTVRRAKRWSLEQLRLTAGARVLDVGCGPGDDVAAIAAAVGAQGLALGVDGSAVMAGEASRRAIDGRVDCSFQVADAQRLPLRAGTFDAARIERTLQHLDDPHAAVAELRRVLAPAGRVAIIEPDWETLVVSGGDHRVASAVRAVHLERTAHPRIGRQLLELLRDQGFTEIRLEPVVVTVTRFGGDATAAGLQRDVRRAVDAGMVSDRDAERWLVDLRRAEAEQRFLWAIVNFCVSGRKA